VATTEEVLDHHMAQLAAGDVAAIMQDYAQEAVLINGPEPRAGIEAIEAFFASAVGKGGVVLTEDLRVIEGDYAYITWHSDSIPFGTDTFVVRDGKIVCQTVAVKF
jgi:ketosteroid isomerase-like protein